MSDRAKYSRIYWQVMDDPQFDGIREDVRHFGSWGLMLLAADMAWPTLAYVPPMVPPASRRALVDVGLIELLSGGRFRLRGIDKERIARKSAATRVPVASQLGPSREAVGELAKPIAEQSIDKPTDEGAWDGDPAIIYWQLTGAFPGDKTLPWIDDLSTRYGTTAVIKALATAHIADRSARTLLGRTQDRLRAEARELDVRERKAEQVRLAEKRSNPPVMDAWREEYRQRIQEQYGDAA